MGKPFATELDALSETYRWAIDQPIEELTRAITKLCNDPLIAIGSGGSYSTSQFVCHLHATFAQQSAMAMTPLQATAADASLVANGVLIPTARGNNPDVIGSVREIICREPKNILVVCANPKAKIAGLVAKHRYVNMITFDMPFGTDGFLATNSLLGFSVLLARSYALACGCSDDLPKHFSSMLQDKRELDNPPWLDRRYAPLWSRKTLIVLHGPSTQSAAIDIESKFSEAALGNVQIADYRQFAHGRHHWLAKHAEDTAILAISSKSDQAIAEQTLAILPKQIPICTLGISFDGWLADLSGLIRGFFLVGSVGRAREIDPGRPGVPPFGRKLYHANAFARPRSSNERAVCLEEKIIERKTKEPLNLASATRIALWQKAFSAFSARLSQARFPGVVFDYDGTLCDEDERFDPLPKEIATTLTSLLRKGIIIGIATGRGKSVRSSLREAFPKKLWKQIIVGYYNGGEILNLSNESVPNGTDGVIQELQPLTNLLASDPYLSLVSSVTRRQRQITLTPKVGVSLTKLWGYCNQLILSVAHSSIRVLKSGHSIDILPNSVTKRSVPEAVRAAIGGDTSMPILCIGDRGCWPGNDFELLDGLYTLSVHEVSPNLDSCWNLAPPGQRGRDATLAYLREMKVARNGVRIDCRSTKRSHR